MASDQDKFRLVSPQINHEGRLPRKYTQEGQGAKKNVSPPLEWYNVPEGTKSLALVVEDIDAPDASGLIVPWIHWVVINIPPTIKGLPGKRKRWVGNMRGLKKGTMIGRFLDGVDRCCRPMATGFSRSSMLWMMNCTLATR